MNSGTSDVPRDMQPAIPTLKPSGKTVKHGIAMLLPCIAVRRAFTPVFSDGIVVTYGGIKHIGMDYADNMTCDCPRVIGT